MAGTGNTTKNLTKLANQFAEYLKHSTKFDCALKSVSCFHVALCLHDVQHYHLIPNSDHLGPYHIDPAGRSALRGENPE
jgi:hypothetical protein